MKEEYELNKCEHVLCAPIAYWHNGMVYDDENLAPEVIATFDSKEEALATLEKYTCSARYMGGVGSETRATEYWVELVVYDEDDEPVEWPECYTGEYPYCKVYDEDEMMPRYPDSGFIALADDAEEAKSWCQSAEWIEENAGDAIHLCVVNMNGEKIASYKIK